MGSELLRAGSVRWSHLGITPLCSSGLLHHSMDDGNLQQSANRNFFRAAGTEHHFFSIFCVLYNHIVVEHNYSMRPRTAPYFVVPFPHFDSEIEVFMMSCRNYLSPAGTFRGFSYNNHHDITFMRGRLMRVLYKFHKVRNQKYDS